MLPTNERNVTKLFLNWSKMLAMKERIDPLIEERAPWLFEQNALAPIARDLLMLLLGYQKTLQLAQLYKDWPADRVMTHIGRLLARDLNVSGLDNLPRHGPALIVANHPTGIADGIMLHQAICSIRPDVFIYANSDILRILPQFESLIAPVEWRQSKRTHAKTRETMIYTRRALAEGRIGMIFPSGRLAKRHWLNLHEREWMASAATIARKFDLPIIPVNIHARNSALFYLFDLIHPTLRDITLFSETLNKAQQPYRLTIGAPISASDLPITSKDSIEMLKGATLQLGATPAPSITRSKSKRLLRSAR